MTELQDALGTVHNPATGDVRIACLVPSITELLFALQLEHHIVARTHYCIHPREHVNNIASVGGTKKINHARLRALAPSHVILNIDENTRELAERVADYVPQVIVTQPLAPLDNLALYRLLGGIFNRQRQAVRLGQQFSAALQRLQNAAVTWPQRHVLYLIWREPWMTVAADTYIARTLGLLNWLTVPRLAAQRYPSLTLNTGLLAAVDWVLFSTEPYAFSADHVQQFAATYRLPREKLVLIDGAMTSGTVAARLPGWIIYEALPRPFFEWSQTKGRVMVKWCAGSASEPVDQAFYPVLLLV